MKIHNKECAIIVSSCDNFRDAWQPFFTLFFRYWPDCPFPVYLISNYAKFNNEKVNTICVGSDMGWATNLELVLNKINTKYIIYFQEDYFFLSRVNTKTIISLLNIIKAEKLAHIRLVPTAKPDSQYLPNPNLGIISKNRPYRVSLQAGIWDTNILKKLIVKGEQAWEMELNGSSRSDKLRPLFLSTKKPAISYYLTGIVKGKWEYGVQKFLKREGIKINTDLRKIEKYKTYLKRNLRTIPVLGYFFKFIFLFTEKYKRNKR